MSEITVMDAAGRLGCGERQVRSLLERGYLRGRRIGRRVLLIEAASVQAHRRKYPDGIPPGRKRAS
jgi:excisionase family DNA binding protein